MTSSSTMSIWPEVMEALKVLVFAGADLQDDQLAWDEQALAVSLSDSGRRSLVVNPMASLVQVTAEWDRVRRVAELLDRLEESPAAAGGHRGAHHGGEPGPRDADRDQLERHHQRRHVGPAQDHRRRENIAGSFFQFVVNSADVTAVLEAVDERRRSAHRLHAPRDHPEQQKACVARGHRGRVLRGHRRAAIVTNGVGTEPVVNYTPKVVPVGVVLDVTPQVGRDRVITLNVHPTISDVVSIAESPNQDTAPVLSIRELDTGARCATARPWSSPASSPSGRTTCAPAVPVLKDLPLLGYLFGKTSEQKTNSSW